MNHFVIGTAGHIDHGKTSLVRALTGTNTDTLKEEQEREITIDIGFAFMGEDITIIDVPGHEKFVKNMVAGVSTIDFVTLVIAADDGIMPQTKEHLDILRLLGIKNGCIVITKADMVEEDWLELVAEEIKDYVSDSFLGDKELFIVDSISGKGIEELKSFILNEKDKNNSRNASGVFRLPIDRVFSMKGHGTVVTGTILSGSVKEGDTLNIQPEDIDVKVRSMQSHGVKTESLKTGNRAAINLNNVSPDQIKRGDILTESGYLTPTWMADCKFYLLESSKELKTRSRIRVHAGTKEVLARIVLLDRELLKPGEECYVQLRLEEQMSFTPGERYVIRSYSPMYTIGGGEIIRVTSKKAKLNNSEILESLMLLDGSDNENRTEKLILDEKAKESTISKLAITMAVTIEDVSKSVQKLLDANKIIKTAKGNETLIYHTNNFESFSDRVISSVKDYHKKNPLKPGMDKADFKARNFSKADNQLFDYMLGLLVNKSLISLTDNFIKLYGFEPVLSDSQKELKSSILSQLNSWGYKPESLDKLAEICKSSRNEVDEIIYLLTGNSELIRISDEFYLTTEMFESAKTRISEYITQNDGIKLGDVGNLLDSSRKYALPLMEYLDKLKFTRRDNDKRMLF